MRLPPPTRPEYHPCGCCPLWDADVGDLCACADAAAAWSCWEAVGRGRAPARRRLGPEVRALTTTRSLRPGFRSRRFAERSKPAASGPMIPLAISRFRIRSARACIRIVIIKLASTGGPRQPAERIAHGCRAAGRLAFAWKVASGKGRADHLGHPGITRHPAGWPCGRLWSARPSAISSPATAGLPSPLLGEVGAGTSPSLRQDPPFRARRHPGLYDGNASQPQCGLWAGPAMIGRCACRF